MTYEFIRRKVKYPRVEIKDEKIRVIIPPGMRGEDILKEAKVWIDKKIKERKEILEKAKQVKLIERSIEDFKKTVLEKIEKFSKELNVDVKKVRFRKMKSRWGSCSSSGNITINILARYLPDELIDYIIFHELVHRIEMNHSRKFWNLISKKFSNINEIKKLLSIYYYRVIKVCS